MLKFRKLKKYISMSLTVIMLAGSCFSSMASEMSTAAETAVVVNDETEEKGTVLNVTDFGADPSGKNDSVIPIQKALEAAKEIEGSVTLNFPEGEYHFWPEDATVRRIYISNSTTPSSTSLEENAIRTIGILMEDIDDLTIEGNNSTFLFHGKMMSFVAINCRNLTIQNLTYDFVLPAVIDLTVEKVAGNTAQVYLPDVFEYEIVNGNNLIFYGEKSPKTGKPYWTLSGHPYDQVNEMNTGEIYRRWDGAKVLFENCTKIEEIGNQRFLFTYSTTPNAEAGYNVQIKQTVRDNPSILLWTSENIVMKNLDAMHLHSFGIVGQFSKDITLDDVNVVADARKGTLTAAAADMMQMSGCGGKITVKNCNFTNPQDDPINIHGTFLQIEEIIDSKTIRVRYMERETYGFPNYYVGDEVDIVSRNTLNTVQTYTVTEVENPEEDDYTKENRKLITLSLDGEIPEEVVNSCSSYVVENVTYTPEVHITDCIFDQSPVRGVLCTTRRKVVIENCIFRNMNMSSIFVSDDANGWYESGYCRDVTIRNNVFELCNNSSINFGPVVYNPDKNDPLHKNVVIEGNIFLLKDKTAIDMTGVENVTIKNNQFRTYEDAVSAQLELDNTTLQIGTGTMLDLELSTPTHSSALFKFSCCKNVVIEDNQYGEGLNVRATVSNMDSTQISSKEVLINQDQYVEEALENARIMYKSTDETVAQMKDGQVVGISVGEADIYAVVCTDTGEIFESNRITVHVIEENEKILSAIQVTAEKDCLTTVEEKLQLHAGAIPETAEVGQIIWSVRDAVTGGATSAAQISQDGVLTAKSSGTVEVKAETETGIYGAKLVVVSLTEEVSYVNIEYPVEGQIKEITKNAITVYPSNKNGFCDNVNRAENLITIPLPTDQENAEATVLLTGSPISTYEEVGFGFLKDVDNYVSVSTKKHLGTMLYNEVNTEFDESLRIANIGSPAYLKITKTGNVYAGYYKKSIDDEWTKIAQKEVNIGSDLKVAMWAANRSSGVAGDYVWSDLTINGETYEFKGENTPPTVDDVQIGISGNTAAISYIFEDEDGNSEGNTKAFWYISDEENGVYKRLSAESELSLDCSDYAGGKYIKAMVVPYDQYGVCGKGVWTKELKIPEREIEDIEIYEGVSVDAHLKTLELGTELSPVFERSTMRYIASVLESTETVLFQCETEDTGAAMTVTVNDQILAENVSEFSDEITLLSGFNYIYIHVIAEDDVTEMTYRVVAVRPGYQDGTLSDLKVNGVTVQGFDPEVTEYQIVLDEMEEITLEAAVNNKRARLMLSDGKTVVHDTKASWMTVPGTNSYIAAVRSESYGTYKYYTVNVKVPGLDCADLMKAEFSNVTWEKEFRSEITQYVGTTSQNYVPFVLESTDLNANIVISGNGVTYSSENGVLKAALPLSAGENDFTVEVKSLTETKTYLFKMIKTSSIYLSDLDWVSAQAGYGNVQRDCETDGIGIRLTGEDGQEVSYEKGIGTHASSEIVYDLKDKGYEAFQAYVGVDYSQNFTGSPASVTFSVYLNDKNSEPVFDSGEMFAADPQKYVNIPILDTDTTLYLIVEKGTNNWNDHADWADAKFIVFDGRAELKAFIDCAAGLAVDDYTEESWSILKEAVEAAEEVYENKNADQETIQSALTALKTAINALEKTVFAITKQPESIAVSNGTDAVVTVEATGKELSYIWYYKNPGNAKFYMSGNTFAEGNTYRIPMNAWRDGQQVYCVITDAEGNTLTSDTVTLSLTKAAVTITKQPESITVEGSGDTAVVTVEAVGEDLTYTWYYKNPGNVKFYESGSVFAEGNTYSIPMNKWRDGQQVYCVITDATGNMVQTETATLNIQK